MTEPPPAPPSPRPPAAPPRRRAVFTLLYVGLAFGLLMGLNHYLVGSAQPTYPIAYSTFLSELEAGNVATLDVAEGELQGVLREAKELPLVGGAALGMGDGAPRRVRVERFAAVRVPGDGEALPASIQRLPADKRPAVVGHQDSGVATFLLFWIVAPIVVLGGLFLLLRLLSPNRQVMSFGKSRARVYAERETKITFDQVAGIEEAKEELREVVEFLRDPQPYQRLGARIPRGILLVGPPGTGKTLLARAVAGEASVVFFSLSGSDFVEMFAGVGASRVRDLFEQAQKQSPCIVFIDELDALGKVRGVGFSGAHDEREQTLNQLLSEMDGFDPNSNIVILAATNRPEILDPALLRPGRFDRQVVVDRPDVKGREAILRIHGKKVKLADDVDLGRLARQTPGLVGADLANVINEAALLAGRRRKDAVGQAELEEAIQRTTVGLERKSHVMSPQEKERTAVHETGHALVALSVGDRAPVTRVSIVARGMTLGHTMQVPEEDKRSYTRAELLNKIAMCLGGRGAELLIYGDTSTGASDDLARAASIARAMVVEFGMSERFGPLNLVANQRRQRFLAMDGDGASPDYSDETAREVDEEIRALVREAEARVRDLLKSREPALRGIAAYLVQKEVIGQEELKDLARTFGAPPVEPPPSALQVTPAPSAEPAKPA